MARPDTHDEAEEPLPKGITKEVLTPADPSEVRGPKKGDECSVHYEGRLEFQEDCFDNSRERTGRPVTFTLGSRQVIEGWELAVATMKKGEISRFTCAPQYAYGEQGMGGKIPPDATLVFDIELVSWKSDEDVLGDGSVLRTRVREGFGFDEVEDGTEVLVKLKALSSDGMLLDHFPSFEYTVGTEGFGLLSKAVTGALADMKKGAAVSLWCDSSFAAGYGDGSLDSCTLELELLEIYELVDVSPRKDKAITKKRISAGEDFKKPGDGAEVQLKVKAAVDEAGEALPGFAAAELCFVLGDGDVCDALEFSVLQMVIGERAVITSNRAICADGRLGLAELEQKGSPVRLTVELLGYDSGKPQWDMSPEEKMAFASQRKEVGTKLFKAQRFGLALERYSGAVGFLKTYIEMPEGGDKLVKVCELNRAACLLKLEDYFGAKSACSEVLKAEPDNAKALFRRATALLALREQEDAIADCRHCLKVDPNNNEAKRLLNQCIKSLQEEKKKASGFAGLMHKAFSGFAEEEETRARVAKEAHEESIRKQGAQARADAAKRPAKNMEEQMEDMMRAQESMGEMQKKIRAMELERWEALARADGVDIDAPIE